MIAWCTPTPTIIISALRFPEFPAQENHGRALQRVVGAVEQRVPAGSQAAPDAFEHLARAWPWPPRIWISSGIWRIRADSIDVFCVPVCLLKARQQSHMRSFVWSGRHRVRAPESCVG